MMSDRIDALLYANVRAAFEIGYSRCLTRHAPEMSLYDRNRETEAAVVQYIIDLADVRAARMKAEPS
jgi:hypothetical protein